MSHLLGMSGSTIMSNPDQFSELFQEGLSHIEIGEFPDRSSYQKFLKMLDQHGGSFGIHAPLIRGNSKYDLIEEVTMSPQIARSLFEEEVKEVSEAGASYVLVHFPYFKGAGEVVNERIEEGLQFLHKLQETYHIPIVCEPKLGKKQSPHGIQYLNDFPASVWQKYGLHICIDLGDYRMAAGDQWPTYLQHLLPFTKVVHMHNVKYNDSGYYWVPLHPDLEEKSGGYEMRPCLELLIQGQDKYFIFEHTPHTNPSKNEVEESIKWVRNIVM